MPAFDLALYEAVVLVALHQTDVSLRGNVKEWRVYFINADARTYGFMCWEVERDALDHYITLGGRAVCVARDGRTIRRNFMLEQSA